MQNEKKYFASANTEKGFTSYFKEVFGGLDMLYIIKGGPGTGKSHFIRSISDEAEKMGYSVEYFYCSSDPLSLDGIIIEELKVGVIDGTPPHSYDCNYPGVRDKIINLGEHWNADAIKKHSDTICNIIDAKKSLYNNVYNYLAAAGRVETEIRIINGRAIKHSKMMAAVSRISKGWKGGKGFSKKIRPIEGISHVGRIVYDTYHDMAENKYVIKDRYGIGGMYLDLIMKEAEKKELKVVYSPGIIDTSSCVAIYLPEVSSSFVIGDDDSYEKRRINMDRFVDAEFLKRNKQKNRFARRCLSSLYEGVQKGFDEIYEKHTALEKYYIEAMDFDKNNILANRIKEEIFSL